MQKRRGKAVRAATKPVSGGPLVPKAGIVAKGWCPWRRLGLEMEPDTLAMVLDDGQAFRWHLGGDGAYTGLWANSLVRLRVDGAVRGPVEWCCPEGAQTEAEQALRHYLAMEVDWVAMADALPWRSDERLAACMRLFPGLRMLRQPLGETLLGFMCSATKQIPQIKQMVDALARTLGDPLSAGGVCEVDSVQGNAVSKVSLQRLPSWERIADATEVQLRACGLGFRAANIHRTARFLAANPGWLEESAALPYERAHERLVTLAGVGAKIADCVLLYSGAQPGAFPVDTWIIKVMTRHYGLSGWTPEQVAHFGRKHFGAAAAGLAQQYLFNGERMERRR